MRPVLYKARAQPREARYCSRSNIGCWEVLSLEHCCSCTRFVVGRVHSVGRSGAGIGRGRALALGVLVLVLGRGQAWACSGFGWAHGYS